MPKSKQTLSDKISAFLTTAPTSQLSDEEDETSAKVCDVEQDDENEDLETFTSSMRKLNTNLLEDDEKYAGKKCSRKDLADSDDSSLESNDDNEDGKDGSMDENSDVVESCDSDGEEEQEDEELNSDEQDEGSDEQSEGESDEQDFEDESENVKNFSNDKTHMKKGQCVKNQLNIWESLLEMRIQLQKSTVAANKLPLLELRKTFEQESEFSEAVDKTKKTLTSTLDKLLELQNTLLNQYSETKKLLKKGASKQEIKPAEESDEEIPSDTEDEMAKDESEDEETQSPVKRRKLNDYEKDIKNIHSKYKPYRNSVINTWNEKTRLDTKSLTGNSVLNQIEHILNDKARLIKRSQTKKSQYTIIGEEAKEEDENKDKETQRNEKSVAAEEHNPEIYDDDDFYHQLLRELIEVKSAEITDPVQLSRQWIQLQNLRSKMKRKIDTKCTKGRKIRYTVHNKLVNFMAPIDHSHGVDSNPMVFDSIFK